MCHDVGDMALVEAAGLVRGTLRVHDLFGRLGGEEFAGFLPETDLAARSRSASGCAS